MNSLQSNPEAGVHVPQGSDPAEITIEEAVNLIGACAARAADGGGKKKRAARQRLRKKRAKLVLLS